MRQTVRRPRALRGARALCSLMAVALFALGAALAGLVLLAGCGGGGGNNNVLTPATFVTVACPKGQASSLAEL
jgi:hypothetical protein